MRTNPTCACLLAFAASALAGKAHVVNNCNFDVWFSATQNTAADNYQKLGREYSHEYTSSTSIKFGKSKNPATVAQFEFHNGNDGKIWYDTSNIDGNPFQAEGTRLSPSVEADATFNTCVTVDCPPGAAVCTVAYNHPDDTATKNCAISTDLTFTLCSGNSGSSSNDSGNESSGSSNSNAKTSNTQSSNNNADAAGDNDSKAVVNDDVSESATTARANASPTGSTGRWGHHRRGHVKGIGERL